MDWKRSELNRFTACMISNLLIKCFNKKRLYQYKEDDFFLVLIVNKLFLQDKFTSDQKELKKLFKMTASLDF